MGAMWFLLLNRLHKRKWQLLQCRHCSVAAAAPVLQTREEETFREYATPRVRAEAGANLTGSSAAPQLSSSPG